MSIYTGKYIVYKPDSKLWVGLCDNFVHAFLTQRQLFDPETWFIGKAEEHTLIIKGRGHWVKFDEPKPMRHERGANYRGPLDEVDQVRLQQKRDAEQFRRDQKRAERLFG